ncbi:MAG: hypothetical protein KUG82_12415 [Pseudomonadales bacterium]|nr:hypothetical protein [Pseudomonadales bacterium]
MTVDNSDANLKPVQAGQIYRKMSPIERSYLYHDKYSEQSIILNAVVEGHGEFNLDQWQTAMDKIAQVHPGTRVVRAWKLGFSKWRADEPHIPVTLIEDSLWDGMGPENADFIRARLSPVTGPVCEVLLVKSDKLRIVFRMHHAVTDASGLRQIIDDAFRILKGEKPIGSNSTLFDVDMLDRIKGPAMPTVTRTAIAPTGPAKGTSLSHIWLRKKIAVREFKLIPKMMLAIKLASDSLVMDRQNSGDTKVRLTVDLRRHLPRTLQTTANCSGAFDVCVSHEDTIADLNLQIRNALRLNEEIPTPPRKLLTAARWVPTKYHSPYNASIVKVHESGRYQRSGTLTMIGKGDMEKYTAAGFIAETAFAIPIPLKLLPFFMALWVQKDGVEMVIGMPELLGNDGRLEQFVNKLDTIISGL